MGEITSADRVYRRRQLQTGRRIDQALDAVRMTRRRPIDVLVHIAA